MGSEISLVWVRDVISSIIVILEWQVQVSSVVSSRVISGLFLRLWIIVIKVGEVLICCREWLSNVSVRSIRLSLIRYWLRFFRCGLLFRWNSSRLDSRVSGVSNEVLKLSSCIIRVVLMLVLSIIVSVGVRFRVLLVVKDVVIRLVVVLFCSRLVMLSLVSRVSQWLFRWWLSQLCSIVLKLCSMLLEIMCVFYNRRVMVLVRLIRRMVFSMVEFLVWNGL